MIGIIGDSNSGKSTLLNALLGQKLLPQSYKSSTSTITLASLSDVEEPRLSFMKAEEMEIVEGKRNIHTRIKVLNEEVRVMVDRAEVMTLQLASKGRKELVEAGVCDGQMTLVDMPGQDESDNPVVKQCLGELLSRCHGLFIIVKHDAVKSDRLAVLVDRLAAQAPHLFRTEGAVSFIISQCDTLRFDDDDDSDESSGKPSDWVKVQDEVPEGAPVLRKQPSLRSRVIKDLKRELRKFLCNRDCLLNFPSFVQGVDVLASCVDSKLVGGFEFQAVLASIVRVHAVCKELRLARKISNCQNIYDHMTELLMSTRGGFPARSEQVIKAADTKANLDKAFVAVSALSFVVTLPFGGWGAVAATALRLGAGSLGAAALASRQLGGTEKLAQAAATKAQMALAGEEMPITAEHFGAIGAEEANKRIEFWLTREQIDQGKAYDDTLLLADGSPLYCGGFIGNLPAGQGRLFWPSTNYESFIGDFVAGRPTEGMFFNEKGYFVGHMQMNSEKGCLEPAGARAEEELVAMADEWSEKQHSPGKSPGK